MIGLIIKYLNSIFLSSIVILLLSLFYFFLRNRRIIQLKNLHQNLDTFIKRLLFLSLILITLGVAFKIIYSFIEQRGTNSDKITIQENLNKTIYEADKDTIIVLSDMEIMIPKGFNLAYSKINKRAYLYVMDKFDSLGAMRITLLVDKLLPDQNFNDYTNSILNSLNKSGNCKFFKSDLSCDYKFSYMADYEKSYDNENTNGTILVIGANFFVDKVQTVYFVNFENKGNEIADFRNLVHKINSTIYIQDTQTNMLK